MLGRHISLLNQTLGGTMKNEACSELAVVYQEILQLVPYPRNARVHSTRQIRQIADSIGAFGFTNPVLVDRATKRGSIRVEFRSLQRLECPLERIC